MQSNAQKRVALATLTVLVGFVAACGPTPAPPSAQATHSTAVASFASPTTAATAVVTPTPDATAGWVSYTSAANHLMFRHPADLHPLECGWVWVDAMAASSCPQGGGFCCVFFRSSDNGQTGSFSLISTNPSLYSGGITRTSVTVDGVSGIRLSGVQTVGQGGGPQVEYDFAADGRSYTLFAYVGGSPASLDANAPSTVLFDQIVQTVQFTA